MILSNRGETIIRGTKSVIGAEFSCLVEGMAKAGFTEEELHDYIRLGLMSEEKLKNKTEAKREEVQKRCDELLDRIFGKEGK